MLLTVKDACEPHPMALDYSMSEQVENLSDVIAATALTAREFFEKNFVTKGMETLLNQGLRRLGGKSDQSVFELKQAMGGGKTHSMIALGLLARDSSLRTEIVPEMARDAVFGKANVVALNGRLGFEETFIWGEIANQLEKGAQFSNIALKKQWIVDRVEVHRVHTEIPYKWRAWEYKTCTLANLSGKPQEWPNSVCM